MDLEVDRSDLRRTRTVPGRPLPDEPPPGTVLLAVSSFAVTANNVTYAAIGDLVGYWRFFPASEDGWGRVPVWGHADVESSSCDGIEPGERFFGFWPMSTHLLVEPAGIGASGFTDARAHRAELPPVYNRYLRAAAAADADADREARDALLRPLFTTSFLIDEWLAAEAMFGATEIVVTSASSKTALGLAHLLAANGRGTVIGATSAPNVEFVEGLGAYDRVVAYDALPDGLGDGAAVLVDFAGDPAVITAVHAHYRDRLRRSVRVGITHHAALPTPPGDMPGPAPEWFFAPDHVRSRTAEWGADAFAERLDAARGGFDRGVGAWLEIDRRRGSAAIATAWTEAVDGVADPRRGIVCAW